MVTVRQSQEGNWPLNIMGKLKIDFYVSVIKSAYFRCNWHGCQRCYGGILQYRGFNNKTFLERHLETMKKKQFLIDNGFQVISMYSCEFKALQKQDPEFKAFVAEMTLRLKNIKPLSPRNTFRGGRTNGIWMYYDAKTGETIYYFDFTR